MLQPKFCRNLQKPLKTQHFIQKALKIFRNAAHILFQCLSILSSPSSSSLHLSLFSKTFPYGIKPFKHQVGSIVRPSHMFLFGCFCQVKSFMHCRIALLCKLAESFECSLQPLIAEFSFEAASFPSTFEFRSDCPSSELFSNPAFKFSIQPSSFCA